MPAKRDYDPVKRREYYLRTRKLKGRGKGSTEPITRYNKKGRGSDEILRDETAKANALRELSVLSEKLKREQEKGNTDSPAYQKALQRYTNALNNYRKHYTNTAGRIGRTAVNQGENVIDTYAQVGRAGLNAGEAVIDTYARAGRAGINAGEDVIETYARAGRAVETTATRTGGFVTKMVTKNGRRVFKTMTGL